MIVIDLEKCQGCRICVKNCPIGAIEVINKKAKTKDNCVVCGICYRVCTFEAIKKTDKRAPENITCTHCPVKCSIPPGKTGACKRYTHIDGELIRNRKLVIEGMASKPKNAGLPYKPLITAVGSGTNYPCSNPAPYIVNEHIDGVDVITVVTEAPLSYSGVKVKIDTNFHIGDEGARVRREGKVVGMVTTEEYGSKMLTIGGANLISGSNDGFVVVRTIVDLVNGRRVKLKIEKGSRIEIQQGMPPIIDGQEEKLMRVGCGSATVGVFARQLSKVVDEAIILDYHIIGLLSEHMAGKAVGMEYSGVIPYGRKSTDGRYFGKPGHGWGGTEITKPQDAIKAINMDIARPGMKILVTETTGQKSALFELKDDGDVVPIDLPSQIKDVIKIIADTCEKSIVSVVYTGGTGGVLGGVTNLPKALTDAIHDEEAKLSIAGAPTYVLPGGGINFMVDVSKMVPEPLTWVPTPATVAPVEYTMTKDKYEEIGGHINRIMSKQELIEKIEKSKMINLLEDGRVFLDYGPIRMLMDISIQEQRKPELAYIVCKHVINEFKRACKYMSVLKGISPIKRSIGSYPISVQKMITSIKRLKDNTFTPLAAVAGAFSDIALEKALRLGAQRAIINNGGDIAFADMRGNPIKVGIPVSGNNLGVILNLTFAGKNIGGICTSGVGGRSFTKGIATAAVAIAENAALADTCATYLGNETNVDAPEIIRCYAEEIDSETDIAGHQITLKVGCLNQKDTYCALLNGVKAAENLYKRHMIQGAVICIGNEVTSIPEDLILLWKEDSENFT